MQFLLLVYYFLRSLILRGPYHTISLLLTELGKDKALHVDTAVFKKSASAIYFHYQGASYLVLNRIFTVLAKLAPNFSFTDIGAGRGRVLFVAEQYGYTHIVGVELDEELVKAANKNIGTYRASSANSKIEVVHQNALDFQYSDRPEIYFMFNPFNAEVLGNVLERILSQNKHEIFFVYMNPLYKNEFKTRSISEITRIKSFLYTEAIIYKVPERN